jgi:hypothetical protein
MVKPLYQLLSGEWVDSRRKIPEEEHGYWKENGRNHLLVIQAAKNVTSPHETLVIHFSRNAKPKFYDKLARSFSNEKFEKEFERLSALPSDFNAAAE